MRPRSVARVIGAHDEALANLHCCIEVALLQQAAEPQLVRIGVIRPLLRSFCGRGSCLGRLACGKQGLREVQAVVAASDGEGIAQEQVFCVRLLGMSALQVHVA